MIITFYSYKGGTGRTMAVANCACLLARDDFAPEQPKPDDRTLPRVLAIDWDLEAPGLHKYFESLPLSTVGSDARAALDSGLGVLDLFERLDASTRDWRGDEPRDRVLEVLNQMGLTSYTVPIGVGHLHLMKAGSGANYAARVHRFNWESLFARVPLLFSTFADFLNAHYEYVLIDSRTGTTDTSGICTTLLPEKLAVVFTPNRQSLTGVHQLVVDAIEYRRGSNDPRPLVAFPIPSRLEPARPDLLRQWRTGTTESDGVAGYQPAFEALCKQAYEQDPCSLQDYFDAVGIQQVPDYAFGEPIAVEIEQDQRLSLRRSYQVLTERLVCLQGPWQRLAAARAEQEIRSLLSRAAAADTSGDSSQAAGSYLQAVELHGANPEVEVAELAGALERVARLRLEQGQVSEAEQSFESAIAVAEKVFGRETIEFARAQERYARLLTQCSRSQRGSAFEGERLRLLQKAAQTMGASLALAERILGPGAESLQESYLQAAEYFLRAEMRDAAQAALAKAGTGHLPATKEPRFAPSSGRLRLFISYAHDDDAHKVQLLKHLRPLERDGLIAPWHDRMIQPGEKWGTQIDENLEKADLILLLVSASFLASDYCYDIEMKRALERHRAGEARIIPIIVSECDWQSTPFAKLQALPDKAKPVARWAKKDDAWTSIAKAIRALSQSVRGSISRSEEGTTAPATAADPTSYLTWLRDQHSYLEIRGMGAQVTERMALATVYTRLSVAAPERDLIDTKGGATPPRGARRADPEAIDELQRGSATHELSDILAEQPHAALVGDPGSGKTTFLRFVAQILARAQLGESDALARIGLRGDAPFPIFADVKDVATFVKEHPPSASSENSPEPFYRFLVHSVADKPFGLPADYLRRRVEKGGCMLLLDGLDEVPGEEMRRRMSRLIEQVVRFGKQVGNRHLISCRTRAYQNRVQLGGDVATLRLAPFAREQVDQFVNVWSRTLYRADSGSENDSAAATAYAAGLLRAIADNPSGRTFSESPLMLTVLAVVYWSKRRLPEQRAELYKAAVDYLLESRASQSPYPTTLRQECLQAVAIAMFEHRDGVQRSLGRREAAAAVRPLLGVSEAETIEFLENEELFSGLVVSRTEGEVEFWHLTFQEYLAALDLSPLTDDVWSRRLRQHLHDDRWAEVILLLAGCERRFGIRSARSMIQRVLATGSDTVSKAQAVALVGRMLNDIRPYGGSPDDGTTYAEDLTSTLAIFEPGGALVAEPVRIEVGAALGKVGDPRLRDREGNKVMVAGGTFWMGAQSTDRDKPGFDPEAIDREGPVHRVTVRDLRMSRYPVTVEEFSRFVDEGVNGYLNDRLWSDDGWAWREHAKRIKPDDWASQVGHSNRPVIGVSWYEADAYCRSVGGRLPTEAEWEYVARGAAGRRYPWGNDKPTDSHASFDGSYSAPSPVGIYPRDVNEHGVRDLAGNVWEWCADWNAAYEAESSDNPTGPASGSLRVLRGGSFYNDPRYLRSAYRDHYNPEDSRVDIGFRVAWSLAGGQK